MPATNILYYGDNLPVLRQHIPDESVDLIYLDPPFNSAQSYNVLFAEQDGTRSESQIKAFGDTWRWSIVAEATYQQVVEARSWILRFAVGNAASTSSNLDRGADPLREANRHAAATSRECDVQEG